MVDSILTSIKKLLGPEEIYEHFDADIIMHINSAFSTLTQLGVGPEEGFVIKDKTAIWTDFIQDDKRLEFVKTYINELEWRLNVAVDSGRRDLDVEICSRSLG